MDGGRGLEETTLRPRRPPHRAYTEYLHPWVQEKTVIGKNKKHTQKRLTSALADVQDRLHVCMALPQRNRPSEHARVCFVDILPSLSLPKVDTCLGRLANAGAKSVWGDIVGWLVGWLACAEGKITTNKNERKQASSYHPCCPSRRRRTNDLILYLSELSHSLVAAESFLLRTILRPEVGFLAK